MNKTRERRKARRFAADRQKTDRVADLRLCLPPGQPEKGLQGTRPWGLTCPTARTRQCRTCVGSPLSKSKRRRYPIQYVPMLSIVVIYWSPLDLCVVIVYFIGRIESARLVSMFARRADCCVASLIVEQRLYTERNGGDFSEVNVFSKSLWLIVVETNRYVIDENKRIEIKYKVYRRLSERNKIS